MCVDGVKQALRHLRGGKKGLGQRLPAGRRGWGELGLPRAGDGDAERAYGGGVAGGVYSERAAWDVEFL